MSFILDALKKSENERQRQSGPALFEVKAAPPRARFALWSVVIIVLLAVNLVVVTWVLLRGSHASVASPAPAAHAAELPAAAPPSARTAPGPAPLTSAAPAPAVAPSAAPDADASADPDDDLPAVDAPHAPPAAGVVRATDSGLPTYQDVAASAGIPELKLDVHAFDENPGNRFVFLNGKSLREGESSPEGVRVEAITRDGVILSYHGSKFVLLSP